MNSGLPLLAVDDSLLMAVIHGSNAPLILLDGKLTVLAASGSFCRAFHVSPAMAEGRRLMDVSAGEWNVPQLESLLIATAAGHSQIEAYEMDLVQGEIPARRLVVNAQKLDHSDPSKVRLLLTIVDVTDARIAEKLKDDLLREKGVLLQELQHRVANSLQIIASVLMQSARKTQSEETKANLHDAHLRIMSVAQLQQQLAASRVGEVNLHDYFNGLCRSIAASMIRDHDQIDLSVTVDDSTSTGDVSISLGLIVTELVINSLKHGFPDGRTGTIKVDYGSHGDNWELSVTDDGVGMPADKNDCKAGLGTNIVEALAKSLEAVVVTSNSPQGLKVAISHGGDAAPA